MKIVHGIFSLTTGGTENMLVDIANEQANFHDVFVLVVNNVVDAFIYERFSPRVKVFLLNRKPGSRSIFDLIKINYLLYKILPDVLHCHCHHFARFCFLPKKTKRILTVHGMNYPAQNLRLYDHVVAISESVKRDILRHGTCEVSLVYNGINVDNIYVRPSISFNSKFRIVNVARLDRENKGQHILLAALSILIHEYRILNIQLDFIGDGHSLPFLEKLAEELAVAEYVNFLGNRSRDFVYSKLCEYDLLVQPSIYEGFGLTIAEAMAARLPVLVSDIDGPMEIIQKGLYGAFFKSCDEYDCAQKIRNIYKEYPKYLDISSSAYKWCSEKFSIKNTADKYIEKYRGEMSISGVL